MRAARPRRATQTRNRQREQGAEPFDPRAYFLSTPHWFEDWPNRIIRQFEGAGFTHVRLEQVAPHSVWHLWMRAPDRNMTSEQAGRTVRQVVAKAGTIPRGGLFCGIKRRGTVEAGFILDV